MENLIDLRKQPELPPPHETQSRPPSTEDHHEDVEVIMRWIAPEYEIKTYTRNWFLIASGVALLFVLIAIITQSYFFLTFVALAFLVTIMYVKRTPREITFAIAKTGVYVGRNLLPWGRIKSFWIFEYPHAKELSIETDKALIPYMKLPLGSVDATELRELMKSFLPEKEHQELVADEIGRNLGF